jgi:hypothetical protein
MSKRELQERLWSQEDAEQDVQTYMAKMKLKLKNVPMLQVRSRGVSAGRLAHCAQPLVSQSPWRSE